MVYAILVKGFSFLLYSSIMKIRNTNNNDKAMVYLLSISNALSAKLRYVVIANVKPKMF